MRYNLWAIPVEYYKWEKMGYPINFCKRVLKKFIDEGVLCRKRVIGGYVVFFSNIGRKMGEIKLGDKFLHYVFHKGYWDDIVYISDKYQSLLDKAPEDLKISLLYKQLEIWGTQIMRETFNWGDKIEGKLKLD